jgi:hypothetical protein
MLNERIKSIAIPPRMRKLPIEERGYPVPWFVAWPNGKADFRVVDPGKLHRAVRNRLCWLCGERLGRHLVFLIGPMCAVNRVSSEPPCHRDCAEYAVKACPFLSQPRMRRNTKDMPEDRVEPAGFMIDRNPGVSLLWVTDSYQTFRASAGNSGLLFHLGPPIEVVAFSQGQAATRTQVRDSIYAGLPALQHAAEMQGPEAVAALPGQLRDAMERFA